ncbi:Gfo/Idh/MocA family oxidoreductase [candidate division KSB1 bacterium]|nr:Gfo/Idh/MocA family oxidoreductase [candidate division KSB1 bacterium]
MNRRKFLEATAVGSAVFTIVPRHVLGGPGYVAPSDKIVMAHIGCGTQGMREMVSGLVRDERIQIAAVCDPVENSTNYLDWSKYGIRDSIRELLEEPDYDEGVDGIRCGREPFRNVVQKYYAKTKGTEKYKVSAYADFRELFAKEKDIDAVKIMTPDHLHAPVSMAAMEKGIHVLMHKPLANRMNEAKRVIETAAKSGAATHLLAYRDGGVETVNKIIDRIKQGAIGTLLEIHNWTDRPVWPQYFELPTDQPPVPEGFDWQLWLGPCVDRPYHPHYTHMVFRSWYDFGGGCIADMGIYSLWPVFLALNLGMPLSARAWATHQCKIVDYEAHPIVNTWSFPTASRIQFEYAARDEWPAMYVVWYDGGMQPRIAELNDDTGALPASGMLYVGDKGKILITGRVPTLITRQGAEPLWEEEEPDSRSRGERGNRNNLWLDGFTGGEASPGSFLNAGPISETVCLAAVALRAGRQQDGGRNYPASVKLLYDSEKMQITNVPEANEYLTREYRPGWEI